MWRTKRNGHYPVVHAEIQCLGINLWDRLLALAACQAEDERLLEPVSASAVDENATQRWLVEVTYHVLWADNPEG